MPIELKMRDEISINDLLAIQAQGIPVLKTPHVGNWYINNLALAKLGIAMKVLDWNYGLKDHNFHPHCVISGGECLQIAEADVLMSHAKVTRGVNGYSHLFEEHELVAETHMAVLEKIMSMEKVTLAKKFAKDNVDLVLPMLKVLTDSGLLRWTRYVTSDGEVLNMDFSLWSRMEAMGIYGLTSEAEGWLVPLEAYILIEVTVEMVQRRVKETYQLSGPDMYKYIKVLMPNLSRMYDLVRERLGWSLPEKVDLNMVPVADMRFAVVESRRRNLDELIATWLAVEGNKRTIRSIMGLVQPRAEKELLIKMVQRERLELAEMLRAAVQACPDPFYRIEDANYLTQYDLFLGKTDLYVHPWALSAPMSELRTACKAMMALK